jgi:nucleoside-diphosphate-sugar epimerase
MRILILGGTAFLSAATARLAVQGGHQVTCLARGSTTSPPDGTTFVRADRDAGPVAYTDVAGTDWDAVIDVERQPIRVRQALDALADKAAHFTFVSSISVYADSSTPGQDESGELLPAFEGDRYTDIADYGAAKVSCEQVCLAAVGDRLHLNRPGLITGPGDPSDRFGWWPARFARHGSDDVLVPDALDAPTQIVDVDDLASWLLDAAERRITGTFDAISDVEPLRSYIDIAQQVAGHTGNQVAVDPDFLTEHGIGHWMGREALGLWLPESHAGMSSHSNKAIKQAGMRFRPVREATERALAYEHELGLDRERRTGLSPAKEADVLAAWRERSTASG